ncbi:MAG: IS110 family transposase, partial [Tissierellia bacterium]|nr:IS110 family transposase [Tissierellia bacterium]
MNYTQNEKIKQIDIDTLIIGVDIAKHTHVARAQDYRGVELGKALAFNNSIEGFKKLVNWSKDICMKNEKSKIVVGMEPTGHYWFNIGHFLSGENIKLVLVNPMHVKKTKELDDNSPTKNDLKDAKVIAQLVKDGRYSEPVIPEGIYAELRVAMDERDDINRELGSIKNKIHRWIDKYFPEFPTVFKNIEGKTSLITLREFPFPKDILKLGEQEIIKVWKKDIKRAVGPKRAKKLLKTARISVGIQTGMHMAKKQLMNLLDRYEMLTNQMEELMIFIEKILSQIPGAQEMLSIPGVGVT